MENVPYIERFRMLYEMISSNSSICTAETWTCTDKKYALEEMMEFKKDGYEGAIVRHGDTSYEDGKRSRSLVKFKQCLDDIFTIIDVSKSIDGWGILECVTEKGTTFRVSAPGSVPQKRDVADFPEQYIGTSVRVEFANWTEKNIPFHPIATNYPDDI